MSSFCKKGINQSPNKRQMKLRVVVFCPYSHQLQPPVIREIIIQIFLKYVSTESWFLITPLWSMRLANVGALWHFFAQIQLLVKVKHPVSLRRWSWCDVEKNAEFNLGTVPKPFFNFVLSLHWNASRANHFGVNFCTCCVYFNSFMSNMNDLKRKKPPTSPF